jgi:O-antigen/teichoic acid export membrane protein
MKASFSSERPDSSSPPGAWAGRPPRPGGLLRNSLFLAVSRGLQILTGFFILIALARHLSVTAFGEYSYVSALAQALMTLSYFGIQDVVIREIAKDKCRAAGHLGAGLILRLCLSLAAGIALYVVAAYSDLTPLLRTALFLAFGVELFRSLGMLAYASFQAFERMGYEPLLSGLQALLTLAFVGGAILFDLGLLGVLTALLVALALHFLVTALVAAKKFVRPSLDFSRQELWGLFTTAAVIGVGIIIQMNLMRAGALMLKWLGSVEEVAYFQAAHELIMKVQIFPQALMLAVFPVLSRLLLSDPAEAEKLYRAIFRYILLLGLPVSLYLAVFPEQATRLLFGEKYLPAAGVLRITGLAMVPLALDMLLNKVLIAMNRQRYAAWYAALALGLAVLLNLALIPRFGPEGAAVAALAAYACLLGFSMYFAAKHGIRPKAGKDILRAALASTAACGAAYALAPRSLPAAVIALGPVYFGVLIALGAFPKKDMLEFKAALRSRTPNRRPPTA